MNNDSLSRRQIAILHDLEERGFVSTSELAGKYDVSDMTIRRDARRLQQSGVARSVHGGLMLPHGTAHVAGFAARSSKDRDAKRRIAEACVDLLSPRERIFVDAGTTAYGVARALPQTFSGTIITHSAPVMQAALHLPNTTTIGLGGELLHDSQAFIGDIAISALSRLHAETAFVGAAAVNVPGLYIERNLELRTKRAIFAASDRVVAVVTSSKMGRTDLVHLGGFSDIDILVTDAEPPADIAAQLAADGVEIRIA